MRAPGLTTRNRESLSSSHSGSRHGISLPRPGRTDRTERRGGCDQTRVSFTLNNTRTDGERTAREGRMSWRTPKPRTLEVRAILSRERTRRRHGQCRRCSNRGTRPASDGAATRDISMSTGRVTTKVGATGERSCDVPPLARACRIATVFRVVSVQSALVLQAAIHREE